MAFKPATVVFDACILYPFHLRNIVMQFAVDRLVDARWTDAIHDEWIRNLSANAPAIPIERLRRVQLRMNETLPSANIVEYQQHIPSLSLPDPKDHHVAAAGIAAQASVILTWNLRDFPMRELKKYSLRGENPDVFLSALYDEVAELTVASLARARRNLSKSHLSVSGFVDILRQHKLLRLAAKVRKHLADL
jgi:hypothetical protein